MSPHGHASTALDQVRAACAAVAAVATHVRIETADLVDYAAALPFDSLQAATFDPQYHFHGDPADTVAYILTLDAINFGSGYFPFLHKRPDLSGYFTIAAALTDHFRRHGPLTAQALAALTADGCRAIFDQPVDDGPLDELMAHFATALNELGHFLLDRFAGQPTALVESADRSAARLVGILATMPAFRDVAAYRGRAVPFYKRAQIVAADLALAFDGTGFGTFADLNQLTIFADNLVPHVLRIDGILRYDADLTTRLAAEELLPAGSAAEVEIRATAVHAVELLVAACREQGRAVSARELDYLLWHRGLAPYYRESPRHRTRTIFY